jgi:hypothetical protein
LDVGKIIKDGDGVKYMIHKVIYIKMGNLFKAALFFQRKIIIQINLTMRKITSNKILSIDSLYNELNNILNILIHSIFYLTYDKNKQIKKLKIFYKNLIRYGESIYLNKSVYI